ncbi:MAG: DUF424 family protein [Methanosarcinaceae archaeon]|nr:DUF424 family protein [Methanosarcinaceae archaeon]
METAETLYIKIHERDKNILIAVCDKELIGTKLKYKKREIEISESFYKGEEKTTEEICNILKNATNVNIMGEKSINCAINAGIIDSNFVIYIENVPHALYFLI